MTLEITLISIAVVVLAILFAHKYFESSRGAHPKVADVRGKADAHVETAVRHAEAAVSSITVRNGVLAANGAVVWIARIFLYISSSVSRAFHHVVEHGSRRQESLKQSGAASFYLKRIKDGRREGDGASGATDDRVVGQ